MKTIVHIELDEAQREQLAQRFFGRPQPRLITRKWVTERIEENVADWLADTPATQPESDLFNAVPIEVAAPTESTVDNPPILRPFSRDLLRRYYAFLDDAEKERLWKRAVGLDEEAADT